jgi:hypothetical protein
MQPGNLFLCETPLEFRNSNDARTIDGRLEVRRQPVVAVPNCVAGPAHVIEHHHSGVRRVLGNRRRPEYESDFRDAISTRENRLTQSCDSERPFTPAAARIIATFDLLSHA